MEAVDGSPFILSVESATLAGSVALALGERVIAAVKGVPEASHSETLLGQIDYVLREAGIALRRVDLFAVALGPGSFTGLRIGLATIKSLGANLSRPCAGVQSLEAVAYAAGPSSKTLAALPAGRGELFSQLFSVPRQGFPQPLNQPTHLGPGPLLEKVKDQRNLRWAGDGALLYSKTVEEFAEGAGIPFAVETEPRKGYVEEGWIISPPIDNLAVSVSALAFGRYLGGDISAPADLKAIYVRPSDAEIKKS